MVKSIHLPSFKPTAKPTAVTSTVSKTMPQTIEELIKKVLARVQNEVTTHKLWPPIEELIANYSWQSANQVGLKVRSFGSDGKMILEKIAIKASPTDRTTSAVPVITGRKHEIVAKLNDPTLARELEQYRNIDFIED